MKKLIFISLFFIMALSYAQSYVVQIYDLQVVSLLNPFRDQMYLKVSIDGGDTEKLNTVVLVDGGVVNYNNNEIYFNNSVSLQLYEEDMFTGDDYFGELIIKGYEAQKGKRVHYFSCRGGEYRLTYEVFRNE